MSVVIHEVCHGYAAQALGDPTARYAGRMTLNPLKHLDPIGSIIVPFILAIIPPHMVFGWAKPVPVNPYNFRNQKWGEVLVAAAGPGANLVVAVIFGLIIRFGITYQFLPLPFLEISKLLVLINILLAIFNFVPIAPLDGSKILFGLLPDHFLDAKNWLERHSFVIFLFFIFFLWKFIEPLVALLFRFVTGL